MEYTSVLNGYGDGISDEMVASTVAEARGAAPANMRRDVYSLCYSCIDLTSLNVTDTDDRISAFARKAAEFRSHFPDIPNVASICVYPAFVDTVGLSIGDADIAITSVSGGFPSSQTFLEVKMLETAMAVENGADEIDIVLSLRDFLSGNYEQAANEISLLKAEAGEDVVLKVIIESGALQRPELIYKASVLSMLAGADFIKTSTGKIPVPATPEAAVVMCTAIRDYHAKTGRKVGFKAAGGVATACDAALYYTIVERILGQGWLTPEFWRIGASSLANNLLGSITGRDIKYY